MSPANLSSSADAPPALIAGSTRVHWLSPQGEIEILSLHEAARRVRRTPPLVCHARATARRLQIDSLDAYDVLELFAFVRPAAFCPPTPRGLAQALGLTVSQKVEDQAVSLRRAASALLRELAARGSTVDPQAAGLAAAMSRAGWLWGPYVLQALQADQSPGGSGLGRGYRIWERLEEWSEQAPEPPPGDHPVAPAEARARLATLLGEESEPRPSQAEYAARVTAAFAPRQLEAEPIVVLAEAGTGVGKTLGYVAPASLWAERNGAPVWLSTFTRNLQHQIDGELDRLFPQRSEKSRKVVIRKGRENYLCLLNYAERVRAISGQAGDAVIALGLIARWAARSRDGDMIGGDFPGWLAELVGKGRSLGLADRRGECIHSACEFYRKCFIEKSIRRARRADLVIANHALVMVQAALGGEEGTLPLRYVFDEGHHLFQAADNAFSAHLSGLETQELRRWLLGNENRRSGGGAASRMRGLRRRLEDLLSEDPDLVALIDRVSLSSRCLPSEGWHARLADDNPQGPAESFLQAVRRQVYARARNVGEGYSLECAPEALAPGLLDTAAALDDALAALLLPLVELRDLLAHRLDQQADRLDSDSRRRIEALLRGLERRALLPLRAWRDMLAALDGETPPDFVDWFAVERIEGRDIDVGFHRHWVDPTEPFARTVLASAHGIVITSATLTDGSGESALDWEAAETRSGARHLPTPALRVEVPSPFDYAEQTRVFVINDVRKDDLDQVAAALRELFLAAQGGALGLFTAISRLRGVHSRIARPLEDAGLSLLAQHIDGLDVSTLVEIFRAEPDSCLLGTDAVRDGVDVPGRALRLIAFDRVPWPRPDLRHKARRTRFGGRHYDDMLTRLKLRQAFGRLVRRSNDYGVFVLLDPMMPSRLAGAFPEGVALQRVGLAEAIAQTRAFLGTAPV